MLSVRNILASVVLATAALTLATPALAGKAAAVFTPDPVIVDSGIGEMDTTFRDAAKIQANVASIYKTITDARANLNTALGVATDAPIGTALADLQGKAAGKLKVAMDGTKPKLKASDAVPENVQKGMDATNGLVDAGAKAVADSAALVPQAKALGTTAAAFPMKVPTLLGTLTGEQVKTAPKIVGDNVKAIKLIPTNIQVIADEVTAMFEEIKKAFGG